MEWVKMSFIEDIAKYVKQYAPQYNITVYSPIIAQAILESASGTSELAQRAYNYFGLKYNTNQPNRCPSAEGYYIKIGSEQKVNGSYVSSTMYWQKFPNMAAGVKGYFDFLNFSSRYNNLKNVTDPETYLNNIKADGYATSLKYVSNLMTIIKQYNLTQYDSISKQKKEGTNMSNSSLVTCTKTSPNHSGTRTHSIDRITPHCVVGQLSASAIGDCFTKRTAQASCNYGIGTEGGICLVVDESKRSWCSSSNNNDQRAVTIECASDSKAPYAFNTTVYNKLIDLCVDICKRNGKTKLLWLGDKEKTLNYNPAKDEMVLTVHRWFANKSCPGDWMYTRMGDLANKVTAKLGGKVTTTAATETQETKAAANNYVVQVTVQSLNIRKGPGLKYQICGSIKDRGKYTIVEEQDGWGRLKSGAGWISLNYTKKC
jgi:hypothetical protein